MAQVSISVNSRKYLVACDDGQEAHLQALGEYIDEKVQELVNQAGQIGDSRLLVMAALVIADELYEAQRTLESDGSTGTAEGDGRSSILEVRTQTVAALESCADRIENIAGRLQEA